MAVSEQDAVHFRAWLGIVASGLLHEGRESPCISHRSFVQAFCQDTFILTLHTYFSPYLLFQSPFDPQPSAAP